MKNLRDVEDFHRKLLKAEKGAEGFLREAVGVMAQNYGRGQLNAFRLAREVLEGANSLDGDENPTSPKK